jgi:O-antigen/teichoic acid export membrane protein
MIAGAVVSIAVFVYAQKKYEAIQLFSKQRTERLFSFAFVRDSFLCNLCFTFMMNIDVIFVRIFFTNHITGIYSSAMMLGRILVFAAMPLCATLYPYVVSVNAKKQDALKIYRKTIFFCLFLIFALAAPLVLFRETTLTLMFGERYLAAVAYMLYSYALAITIILNYINMTYSLAVGRSKIPTLSYLTACLAAVIAATVFNNSIEQLITGLSLVFLALFIANLIYILKRNGGDKCDDGK